MPAIDYDLRFERDQVQARVKHSEPKKRIEQGVVDALDNFHEKLAQETAEGRKYIQLRVQFPKPIQLSGEVLFNNKEFEETHLLPVCGRVPFKSKSSVFYWKVARIDTESFKKGKTEVKEKKSAGAALFEDDSSPDSSPAKAPGRPKSGDSMDEGDTYD